MVNASPIRACTAMQKKDVADECGQAQDQAAGRHHLGPGEVGRPLEGQPDEVRIHAQQRLEVVDASIPPHQMSQRAEAAAIRECGCRPPQDSAAETPGTPAAGGRAACRCGALAHPVPLYHGP